VRIFLIRLSEEDNVVVVVDAAWRRGDCWRREWTREDTARSSDVSYLKGDFIGMAIARKFLADGYTVFTARRTTAAAATTSSSPSSSASDLGPRRCALKCDARDEAQVAAFLSEADAASPHGLELAVFNVGANVRFPIGDTTTRVFTKVWEMACLGGFLTGREA
jgi:NAD(P)-dependent dehydrogenase (short-subunit alcohol dehydrogenase family)